MMAVARRFSFSYPHSPIDGDQNQRGIIRATVGANNMLYPDDKTVLATVTLPTGEQLSGIVSHIDDFTVGIRIGDKNGWYRSFPRSRVKLELKDPLAAHRELLPKISQTQMHDLFTYLYSLK